MEIVYPISLKYDPKIKVNIRKDFHFKDLDPGRCFICFGSEKSLNPTVYFRLNKPIQISKNTIYSVVDLSNAELIEMEEDMRIIPLDAELGINPVNGPIKPSEME